MNEYLKNLAERAVKAKGWEWMAGMVAIDRNGARHAIYAGHINAFTGSVEWWPTLWSIGSNHVKSSGWEHNCFAALPDISDPATIGCLLALVRKKHGPEVFVCNSPVNRPWRVYRDAVVASWGEIFAYGESEAEALVAALEAE